MGCTKALELPANPVLNAPLPDATKEKPEVQFLRLTLSDSCRITASSLKRSASRLDLNESIESKDLLKIKYNIVS